ncbi:cell wall-associated NlpC family hydrolase [Peribacillus deserti]|uniref:Cell wall-associated NlpC family hydrolase n=1 Tax=Peribacillus deserti TaxID=673318 RepID=A0ABS2QP16_9BACI|nr:cell wall-associated NlpC family hydrolase [Peribacillus deserti]
MREKLKMLLEERVQKYVSDSALRAEDGKIEKKLLSLKERSAEIVNVKAQAHVKSLNDDKGFSSIMYDIHFKYLIKQKDFIYMEEEIEHRQAVAEDGEVIQDLEVPYRFTAEPFEEDAEDFDDRIPYAYNRLKAVQYSERWWNEFNPAYRRFENDCTSFISQCLRAGGAPMWGQPDRSRGWWYSGKSWSYSWSVAHALKLYLQRSKGLRTKQVARPEQLTFGDIICYDFEGDGRYNHNTIVTGRDAYGMPLVNAHTTNSRLRYWKYEDSTAYTPKIKYTFFRILN